MILLFAATAFALYAANSEWETYYTLFWTFNFLKVPLTFWVNDILMGIFFFSIGLELKREFLEGELSSAKKAGLPIAAALGGMIVPAIIYYSMNAGQPTASGWGIPVATDIAFAVGVLMFLGKRVPTALKVFLLALAVVDDLGAVLVIGLFYSSSTLHPAILGVLVSVFVPRKFLNPLETALQPWVKLLIMPVFALANAGVSLSKFTFESSITTGIIAGLVFGKQIGITLFTWLSVKLNFAQLPRGVSWTQIYGVAWLGGIGFTMSIFIARLAFPIYDELEQAKLGILCASGIAALGGLLILFFGRGVSSPGK